MVCAFSSPSRGDNDGDVSSEYKDNDELYNLDGSDSDETPHKIYPEFNKNDMHGDVYFESTLIFPNIQLIRKALKRYVVQNYFHFTYLLKDKIRVQAICKEESCDCTYLYRI